jgi:hypothetical protein
MLGGRRDMDDSNGQSASAQEMASPDIDPVDEKDDLPF